MSSKELSKQTKTFRFHDPNIFSTSLDNYCDIKITVSEKLYESGEIFYYIDYEDTYSDKNKAKHCHPLYGNDDMDGEIIVKNPLSEQLVNFLLMDYDKLEKFSGNSTSEHYKSCVMRSISNFWD